MIGRWLRRCHDWPVAMEHDTPARGSEKRRVRSDAQANRERVLAAAVTAVLREGRQVPMGTIAAAAGVGIGTLYRHFPTREALVEAAYRNELERWRERIIASGGHPTHVIDRFYFESVYFREPSGILYELATLDGAGFDADETPDALGEKLVLPPFLEARRAQIEPRLTPLPDPTVWRPQAAPATPTPSATTTTTAGADR